MVVALGAASLLGWPFQVLVAVYLAINVAYAQWLKQVVILDVMAVSSGYVIRVAAGAVAVPVAVSNWLMKTMIPFLIPTCCARSVPYRLGVLHA